MPQPRKKPQPANELKSEALGDRIRQFRVMRGLSQAQLASMINVTREAITAYESGRVHLLDEMIVRIAKALAVSTDQILGLTESQISDGKSPSVRLIRRMQKIQNLPAAQQKALLKNIDMFLKASEVEQNA
jgi:transcriptional regulator with XRE-family HTH domain